MELFEAIRCNASKFRENPRHNAVSADQYAARCDSFSCSKTRIDVSGLTHRASADRYAQPSVSGGAERPRAVTFANGFIGLINYLWELRRTENPTRSSTVTLHHNDALDLGNLPRSHTATIWNLPRCANCLKDKNPKSHFRSFGIENPRHQTAPLAQTSSSWSRRSRKASS